MHVVVMDLRGLIGRTLVEARNYKVDGKYRSGGNRGELVGHFVRSEWTWRGRQSSVWYLVRTQSGVICSVRSDFATFPSDAA